MKRTFKVIRGGLDQISVVEHDTVRSKAQKHREFNQKMSDTLKELFPGHEDPSAGGALMNSLSSKGLMDDKIIHLMTPVKSWEGGDTPEIPSQSLSEAPTPAFESDWGMLSDEIRHRLAGD